MLTVFGKHSRQQKFCNGMTRRDVLRIGSMALGGLSLPQLLRLEAAGGTRSSHKSLIMVYLCGGPPHQDMYDIKQDAPREIRGPFEAIKTNVPGIQIGEHLPQLATIMDKLVPIRAMVGARDSHYSYQCMTGHHNRNEPAGGWPHLGAASSFFQGPVDAGVPPFVSLCYTTKHRPYNEPGPGFLGLGHSSFRPTGPSRDDMQLRGMTTENLADRRSLLKSFDRFRRHWDATGLLLDRFDEVRAVAAELPYVKGF